jgi:alpha,alpha-trehalase
MAPPLGGELLRRVEVLEGEVGVRVEVLPTGGGEPEPTRGGVRIRCHTLPELNLTLASPSPLHGLQGALIGFARAIVSPSFFGGPGGPTCMPWPGRTSACRKTIHVWRRWAQLISYDGHQRHQVRRSAITLKLLDHFENGAIVAAPTSSLPGEVGGTRNWDYRYAWVRDAAFSVYALRRIGLGEEAWGFLGWVLDAVERGNRLRTLYTIDGEETPEETEDPEVRGYRNSRPVRWGNAATGQVQHDVHGEILDKRYDLRFLRSQRP